MANNRDSVASNLTGLYKAREDKAGVIPVGARWIEKEPNEYGDFGAEYNKVNRQPINATRQTSKGETVGYNANAGYTSDVTPANALEDMEDFCFAAARRKQEVVVTDFTNTGLTVAMNGDDFVEGLLLFVTGAENPANNGLKRVGSGSTNTEIKVAGVTAEANATALATVVGFEFAAGDASIAIVNGRPALSSAAFDMRSLKVIPGEIVYLGGDSTSSVFATLNNKGWCRVYQVNEDQVIFDKTDAAFSADPGTGKNIRIYMGHVVKNEPANLQREFPCSFRRLLGNPDLENPEIVQSQVISGCVANELTITLPEEDKLTYEVAYTGRTEFQFDNDALTDPTGELVPVDEADAFNSTRDLTRLNMFVIATNKTMTPIFAAFREGELTINNNNNSNKALTKFGTHAITPGTFEVGGSFEAYFTKVEELRAVKENKDVTLTACLYKNNQGLAWDLPIIDLNTDGLEIELNEPIMMPVDTMASRGRKYSKDMDHTVLFVFFPYLPTVASL